MGDEEENNKDSNDVNKNSDNVNEEKNYANEENKYVNQEDNFVNENTNVQDQNNNQENSEDEHKNNLEQNQTTESSQNNSETEKQIDTEEQPQNSNQNGLSSNQGIFDNEPKSNIENEGQNMVGQSQESYSTNPENIDASYSISDVGDNSNPNGNNIQIQSSVDEINNKSNDKNILQTNLNESVVPQSENTSGMSKNRAMTTKEQNKQGNTSTIRTGVRASNLRNNQKTELGTALINKTKEFGHNKKDNKNENTDSQLVGWVGTASAFFQYDKDKDAATNVSNSMITLTLGNPLANELFDKAKTKITRTVTDKVLESKIKDLAAKKAAELIAKKGIEKLTDKAMSELVEKAAKEIAEEAVSKFSTAFGYMKVFFTLAKGKLDAAVNNFLQTLAWNKIWPWIVANWDKIIIGFALFCIGIGIYVSVICHPSSDDLESAIEDLQKQQYNYNYVRRERNFAYEKAEDDGVIMHSDLYDSYEIAYNLNHVYTWLNSYFFNVNNDMHKNKINNVKQMGESLINDFSKRIVVGGKKQYSVLNDAFLDFFYNVADSVYGEYTEDDEQEAEILIEYIANDLYSDGDLILDREYFQNQIIEHELKDYIVTMHDWKSNTESEEDPKKSILSKFKEAIKNSGREFIDINYYEKVWNSNDWQDLTFESNYNFASTDGIYDLLKLLYFVDMINVDYIFDGNMALDTNKYLEVVEKIYDETQDFTFNLIWGDSPEDKLQFIYKGKKNKNTNASILLADSISENYKKIYAQFKEKINSMDKEIDYVEYGMDNLYDIWYVFDSELDYLEQENVDSNLLKGNSKLANSFKALVSQNKKFIKEMNETIGWSFFAPYWEVLLEQLKVYLNDIAKGDKTKSEVKEISSKFYNQLDKIGEQASKTDWKQPGSKELKKVYQRYHGDTISEHQDLFKGNSIFRNLYLFKKELSKLGDITITNAILNPDEEHVTNLSECWKQFKLDCSTDLLRDYRSGSYLFKLCYDFFPQNIYAYFEPYIKKIESGDKSKAEVEKIIDSEIITGFDKLLEALNLGLELNEQKFKEKKDAMYKNLDFEEDDDTTTNIKIYDESKLDDLKINVPRIKKVNIDGTNEIYFLFDDVSDLKKIKLEFKGNDINKWFNDSDIYKMFFIDADYGFDLDTSDSKLQYVSEDPNKGFSVYDDFVADMLRLFSEFGSMVTHKSEKEIDFGYGLKKGDKNSVESEEYDFMEIKDLVPGEDIYSICPGYVEKIDKTTKQLTIKYVEKQDSDIKKREEDMDDDEDVDDYTDEYDDYIGTFGNKILYVTYNGININNALTVGQKIIRNHNGMTVEEKDKSTIIGTAIGDTLKIKCFFVLGKDSNKDEEDVKKEFVNPFFIFDIDDAFKVEKIIESSPTPTPTPSPSPMPTPDLSPAKLLYNNSPIPTSSDKIIVEHRGLLGVFGELIRVGGMLYAVWAIIKFAMGLHDYESTNYQAIWQFFAASVLILGGILLKHISNLR